MKTEIAHKIKLADYKPYPFNIQKTGLIFELGLERTIVKSRLVISRKKDFDDDKILLNGENLEIISIKINGKEQTQADYKYENGILELKAFDDFILETIVAINPSLNKALSGLYVSSNRFCTQCEAEGFRNITFFPDRPDVLSIYFVRLEADKKDFPTLLANGNLVSYGDYEDGRHFAEWDDPWPKPSYLFALVAGEFDQIKDKFKTVNDDIIELNIYVDKGDAPRALYAMDALKRSMKWDEENYLRVYDLDVFNIVAVRDFNAGAMENKGLNIFNSSLLLADSQTATDADYSRIESVIAHEYFHNWSGNRVTCRDWFQLSLKEGFTVFRDQEFSADMRSRAVTRIQNIIALRARQFPEDQGPNAHSVRPHEYAAIDNFYTSTIYEKGAEIIRVAQNIIGETEFLAGAINYFETNDGKAATIEDWLFALRAASENPLAGIERWYSQAGTPIVDVDLKLENQKLTLKLSQFTPNTPNQENKDWVPIPISFAFYNRDGERIIIDLEGGNKANLVNINFAAKDLELQFDNFNEKPILSIHRGFTAPVIVRANLDENELAILAQYDNDPYKKWESLQEIARNDLIKGANLIANNKIYVPSEALLKAYGMALENANQDMAYCALLLQMPTTNELILLMGEAIPEAIFNAREVLAKAIYNNFKTKLLEIHNSYDYDGEFIPNAQGEGMRALNNQALYYLGMGQDGAKIARNAFENAKNMTDTMGALSILSFLGGAEFKKSMDEFAQRWSNNPLVMDKYYGLLATCPRGDLVENVKQLIEAKDFEITNPNRVRAIIGNFALGSPIGFHSKDGKGYELIAQFILKLDKINPSIAARMATSFERVTKICAPRRELAKNALSKILMQEVSKQLQEIVSGIFKSL